MIGTARASRADDGGAGLLGHRIPGMTFKRTVSDYIANWVESDLPIGKRFGVLLRNASRRRRGRPCCGHPGEPGC